MPEPPVVPNTASHSVLHDQEAGLRPVVCCQAGVVIHELAVLLAASAAAFTLAVVSAVAGFGGGVLLLPVFTALFGLRVAVPMLTLTQLSSNASRVWFNRRELQWPL